MVKLSSNKSVDYSIELIGDSSIKYYEDSNYTKLINNNTYTSILNNNTSKITTIYYKSDKSLNTDIIVKIKANNIPIYGVKRNTNSTSSSWERINDSVGLVANAVKPDNNDPKNDFDNIYPWSDIRSYNYDAGTKKITAWYGDSNFKFDGSNGEVLTYIPEFYYKREVIDDIEYQYISKVNQEGFTYSKPFSVGRYKISKMTSSNQSGLSANNMNNLIYSENVKEPTNPVIDILNSIDIDPSNPDPDIPDSGIEPPEDLKFIPKSRSGCYPLTNKEISYFKINTGRLGTNFSLMDYHYFIIQLLYLVEYGDYDSQVVLGKGNTNNHTELIITSGGTDKIGMKSGCLVDDGMHSMIYRGMEDIYGNAFEIIDGINIKGYQAYINYDYTTYEQNVFDGKYRALGYVNDNEEGYIIKLGYDSANPLISLPVTVGKKDESGIKDFFHGNLSNEFLLAGGLYNSEDYAGFWYYKTKYSSDDVYSARFIRNH